MNNILSSEMAQAEIEKLEARKNELSTSIEEKRTSFETADIETRDAVLNELEQMKAKLDSIQPQINELVERKSQLLEQEERFSLMNNTNGTPVAERDIFATDEYVELWKRCVLTNSTSDINAYLKEHRGGASGLETSTSNVPIPTEIQAYIERAWEQNDVLSRITSRFDKAILEIPYEVSADPAVWHDEGGDAPAEEEIEFGLTTIIPKMAKKWIGYTDELDSLAPREFINYVNEEVVYQVLSLVSHAVFTGTATSNKGVQGIIGATLSESLVTDLSFNTANSAVAKLNTYDNITVAMHPSTFFDSIMGMQDTTNRPIYQIMTDNTGKPKYMFGGYPVVFDSSITAYASADYEDPYMIVGDLKAYTGLFPNGKSVQTLVDPYTEATNDRVRVIGKLFAGGNVTKPKRLCVVSRVEDPEADGE